jgi:salicylate hydroxylase
VQNNSWCAIHTGQSFESLVIDPQNPSLVQANNTSGASLKASTVIGVDGARSAIRNYFYPNQDLHFTGQIAYRALLDGQQIASPHLLEQVSVWLGAQLHVVAYPVLQGRFLNVVVIVEEPHLQPEMELWHKQLKPHLPAIIIDGVAKNPLLSSLFHAVENWRYWLLFDRPPLSSAQAMLGATSPLEILKAVGQKVAFLGDAAHPMLPFLAQGAAMAIEDAYTLSLQLAKVKATADIPLALQQYANLRWQRVAKVQSLARRNAAIFHWQGLMAQCRNMGLSIAGQKLTEMAWLYGHEIE